MTSLRETVAMGAAGSDHVVTPELTRRAAEPPSDLKGDPWSRVQTRPTWGPFIARSSLFPTATHPGHAVEAGCLQGVSTAGFRPDSGLSGPVVRRIENLQTLLTASEVDRLVDDYLAGASVNELAERYGVHRATVSAHPTQRGVTRRQPGLGVEEAAEAVKLHLGGVSMRAIAQCMGVGRKAVRRALVEAKCNRGA